MDRWTPHVTVATIVEKDGKYLLVHETRDGNDVYNQPAGHLDEGEGLIEAAIRETREETGWDVKVNHYLGSYIYRAQNGITYLRHGFSASPLQLHGDQALDEGIIEAVWMTYDEIIENKEHMRSPMVKKLIDDYKNGLIYPLAVLHEDDA